MNQRKTCKIGILGGGITGLGIAYHLSESYSDLAIIEKSPRLGGLVGSFNIGKVRLEKYFHHIFHSDTLVKEVIHETGLDSKLDWKTAKMGYFSNGKVHAFDTPFDLLRFSPLSFPDRIRLGVQIWKNGKNPDGHLLDGRTVKDWVESEWSPEIYRKFWRPLLVSKFGEEEPRISAAWLWGRISARANSRKGSKEELGYLRGGFLQFLEGMKEKIETRGGRFYLHQEAQIVTQMDHGHYLVRTRDLEIECETLIMAIPSPLIPKLFPDLPKEEKEAHSAIGYQTILCMPLVMKRPLSEVYWLNVGDPTVPFAGVIEQTNLVPSSDYAGASVAYLFNYLSKDHPRLTKSKDEVFPEYENGLKRIFPNYDRNQIERVMIFKDSFATPIYLENYLNLRPPIRSRTGHLFFANTSHIFPDDRNMNSSLKLAERVAQEVGESIHS